MKKGHLNQILLLTDGCSNRGEDPQAIGAFAKEQGITVNVIGIMDEHEMDQEAMKEVEGIALAGGGVHQLVYTSQPVADRSNGDKKGDDANHSRRGQQ